MVKSKLDGHLSAAKDCCHCLSLKNGTLCIAPLGFLAGVYYLLFFAMAEDLLMELKLNRILVELLIHVQGIIGVLMCAANLMLLIAALIYQEVIILLYLWIVIGHVAVEIVLTVSLMIVVLYSEPVYGIMWFILPSVVSIVLFTTVYIPVVNGFRRNIHTVVVIV